MLHRDKPRKYTTGWCQSKNCHKCPMEVRAHRFTPQGKELRELRCACRCHKLPESSAGP